MAIEKRKCTCGCGKEFYGTIRRVYFNAACEARKRRRRNKENERVEIQVFNEQLEQIENLEGKRDD